MMRSLLILLIVTSTAHADRRKDMREYVLQAVETLNKDFHNQGYAAGGYYTHDLDYKTPGEIKQSKLHPKTMCVAAVAEVIIVALRLYATKEKDETVFDLVPARSWTKTSRNDIRPYIFMFNTVKSNGTADALELFGLGEQIPFRDLLPGDFVNLNREKTGHAVVFLGFINSNGDIENKYDEKKVVGFKYFSSQGKDNGGFDYRWAYFDTHCPAKKDPAKPRDCGVIWSPRQKILNTGYLLHPSLWRVADAAKERLAERVDLALDKALGEMRTPEMLTKWPESKLESLKNKTAKALNDEIGGVPDPAYNGETTDD